ncbi:MAG: site-specific integrase [Clostridia bacterium]|nr:site-specific integrase [Clostridia bacterium]
MAEVAGLRWCDIHGSSFTVKQTIGRIRDFSDDAPTRTRLEASTPKTKAGRRTNPLSPKMQELLATQRVIQLETRLAQGPAWNAYDLAFCSDLGTPYEGRNLRRALHRTLKKAGLPQMGVHALRHTFATRAIESDMDVRTLSEILGHTKVALTLQLYAHSSMETKQKELAKMDAFL